MNLDLAQFWGTDWDKNPPLTDEALGSAERAFGVQLPAEYVELLRIQNGGYTLGFIFPTTFPTSWADDHVPLEELFGIGSPDNPPSGLHNIFNTPYLTAEWDLPREQILLAGDGHWWITLDYRGGGTAAVQWIDVDAREDLRLAPSFREFLKGLRAQR